MIDHRDRGSASVEAAIMFPALLLIGLLMFAAVRVMTANGQIDAAARAGARAAATGSSDPDAKSRAAAAVSATLSQGSTCQSEPSVRVIGFETGHALTVIVSCDVDTVFGVASRTATGSASEMVSQVRGGLD